MGVVLKTIELSKGKFAVVDDSDYEWLSQWSWAYERYAVRSTRKNEGPPRRRVYMHRMILQNTDQIDHIDGDKLNNSRVNLRPCTHSTNGQNSRPRKKRAAISSSYKGVNWHQKSGKWRAVIAVNGECCHIGLFESETDAATAYNFAAEKYFGEFAKLNEAA